MSKIAIISQPDEGVLIDVAGCHSMQEAVSHLSNTLQENNNFWKGMNVALNLGTLELTPNQVSQIIAIAKGVGAAPKHVFSENEPTRASLRAVKMAIGRGKPMRLPVVPLETMTQHELVVEEDKTPKAKAKKGELVTIYEETLEHSIIEGEPTPENSLPVEEQTEVETEVESEVEVVDENFDEDAVDTEDDVEEDIEAEVLSGDKAVTDEKEESKVTEIKPKAAPKPAAPPVPAVLYLRQTLRSGQTVSHKGHLVIIGDVNPGAEVMAEGDVTVWGALRGIAHAGIGGNVHAEIRALKLQPIQIRIAHAIARSPDKPRYKFSRFANSGPETAKIIDGKIKIASSNVD